MEYVLSLSYGKDSLACLGAIEKLGWPLDRIVHAEVWATDSIPADLPPMVEFKAKADKIIKDRWGIDVEHVCAMYGQEKRTYEKGFYKKYVRSITPEKNGGIWGFPYCVKGAWCNSELKRAALSLAQKSQDIQYVGIAADEPNRYHALMGKKRSPLVEAGWTEADCRQWCEDNSLLSPIYTTSTRAGCWFCHNQGVNQLRLLRKKYPDLWALLLKWDLDSPTTFKPDGHTVHDYELRFQMEDDGLISPDEYFRWGMLDSELNYRLF